MKNADMPAMPQSGMECMTGDLNNSEDWGGSGLTKLEHFTALAIQGICVNAGRNGLEFHEPQGIADKAIEIASLALSQLEKSK